MLISDIYLVNVITVLFNHICMYKIRGRNIKTQLNDNMPPCKCYNKIPLFTSVY